MTALFRRVLLAGAVLAAAGASADVVLVDAPPKHAYGRAGLSAGDVLVGWRLADADGGLALEGDFDSVFDVFEVSTEYAPRGTLTVAFRRGDAVAETVMPPARTWVGEIRPDWGAAVDDGFVAALDTLRGDATDASAVQSLTERVTDPLDRAWLWHKAAETAYRAGNVPLSENLSTRAIEAADGSGVAGAAVWLIRDNAIRYFQTGHPDEGTRLFEETLRRAQAVDPDDLTTALALNNLAIAMASRSEFDRARDYAGAARDIRRRLAPGSLVEAESLHTLGNVDFWTDRLEDASGRYREALAIRERLDPGGLSVARNLLVLANVEWRRGRLDEADALMQRAADGFVANEANDGYLAEMYVTLGHLASDRGRYRVAEGRYLQGLTLFESFAPGTKNHADTVHALGVIALARGDDEVAKTYERRALEIYEPLQPDGQRVGLVLTNLGRIALRAGELDEAEEHFRRSLRIYRNFGEDGFQVATRLADLGDLAVERGDAAAAADRYAEALDILERKAPRSLGVASVLTRLAAVLAGQDSAAATVRLEDALAIAERLAPGTLHEARPAYRLAMLLRDSDSEAALNRFEQAIDAIGEQRRLIGGADDVNARFGARYEHYYKDYVAYLADLGRTHAAFDVLERYRDYSFQLLLAERNLDRRGAAVDASLAAERETLDRRYSLAYKAYLALDGDLAADEVPGILEELRDIRIAQRELAERIRLVSSPTARQEPSAPAAATATLPPDVAQVSFAVLDVETIAFVRRGVGDVTMHRIAFSRSELTNAVRRFRLLARAPAAGADGRAALDALAGDLGKRLLSAALADAAGVSRLVVVPDDVLRVLPFAALRIDKPGGGREYLVERFEVQVAASAAERAPARAPQPAYERTMAAFGTAAARLVAGDIQPETHRRLAPAPLAAVRLEIEAVTGLFGTQAIGLLDDDASETRVKEAVHSAAMLHFATHGQLDDRSPMDSYLLLGDGGMPGDGNGLLQAWEIVEQLDVSGALVTLSACETALGELAGGDGILGLTRAFRLAGAKNVIASLWAIRDASTAELMLRYYQQLRDGRDAAAALRTAQLDFIGGPVELELASDGWLRRWLLGRPAVDFSHPYFWAAFQVYGSPLQTSHHRIQGRHRQAADSGQIDP